MKQNKNGKKSPHQTDPPSAGQSPPLARQSPLAAVKKGGGFGAGQAPQDIQDEIFRNMTADKKIQLASALSMFCLKLNRLNGNNKPGSITYSNSPSTR